MKKLPIGIQTFEKLIKGDFVYADKTKYVYNLVNTESAYFLSRPRRFGKSLLLSTFEALFSGPPDPDGPPQGLFKDLWIGKETKYDFSQKFPVINLSLTSETFNPEALTKSL
ncbi:MAG: AAA family ATPase, partial [Deltaproteobacteria bacterium]|nr:AAA family ATPase [Deltaproteobacteria bacterium]